MSALSDPSNVRMVVIDEGDTPPIVTEPAGLTEDEAYEFLTRSSLIAAADPLDGLPNVEPSLSRGETAALEDDDEESVDTDQQTDQQTGAMIALVPRRSDAERLALPGGEDVDELHLTLYYLGDAVNFSDELRAYLVTALTDTVVLQPAVQATGFGAALWNPLSDEPSIVLQVGGDVVDRVHSEVCDVVCTVWADLDLPEQHTPWVPHVCLAYSSDAGLVTQALERVGPIVFDRVRVAFAGQYTDIPLYDNTVMTASAKGVTVAEDTVVKLATDAPPGSGTGMAMSSGVPGSWEGILVVEGMETGDGREFALGSLDFAPPWLPLNYAKQNMGEHMGSQNVARIDKIWRDPANPSTIRGAGVFDLADPVGTEAYGKVQRGFLKGVSVDVDSVKDADVELIYPASDGDGEGDEDGLAELFAMPEKMIFNKGRIRGATLVDLPAFVDAQIWLTDGTMQTLDTQSAAASGNGDTGYALLELEHGCADGVDAVAASLGRVFTDATLRLSMAQRRAAYDHLRAHLETARLVPQPFDPEAFSDDVKALLASAATLDYVAPPAEWFENPELDGPTPLTVTDDGRVFGHAALWNSYHTSFPGMNVTPPREGEHVYFRLGEVVTAEGARVAVGTITLGTGHASTAGIDPRKAIEHYDNTGTAIADVASGEDSHGIWVSGAVRPGTPQARVADLRAAKLSGDWRSIGGRLRLVALLAVNVPGFGVPRIHAEVKNGRQLALVAAGIVPDGASSHDRTAIREVAASIARRIGRDPQSVRAERLAALRARVHGKS